MITDFLFIYGLRLAFLYPHRESFFAYFLQVSHCSERYAKLGESFVRFPSARIAFSKAESVLSFNAPTVKVSLPTFREIRNVPIAMRSSVKVSLPSFFSKERRFLRRRKNKKVGFLAYFLFEERRLRRYSSNSGLRSGRRRANSTTAVR